MDKKRGMLADVKRKIVPILKKHGVVKAGIFGSFARGDFTKKSDIDVLIKYGKSKSLFDLADLGFELEKKVGRKVDIVTYRYIYPPLKKIILSEEVRIL